MPQLVLKGKKLLEMSGAPNAHQLSLRSMVSYPTVDRYVNQADQPKAYDMAVLLSLLMDGAKLTEQQVLELKIGDLFEIK